MKTRSNIRTILVAVPLGIGIAVAIHLVARKPEKQQAVSIPDAALEPLYIDRSASHKSDALRPSIIQLLDPATPARTRIDLAMACDGDLNNDERMALLAEVSTPPAASVNPGWHSQYFHEICRQLHRQPVIRKDFARVLVAISPDANRSQVEREYAVQHLRQIWHHSKEDSKLRADIAAHFKKLARDVPPLAGPALLSLHLLGNRPGEKWSGINAGIPDAEIEPLVTALLGQGRDRASVNGTMAALRVADERSLSGLQSPIRSLAVDSSVVAIVRMAAISIISRSGEDSVAFLQSITPDDPLVEQAIQLSLKRNR